MRYLKLILSEFFTEHKNNLLLSITIYFTVIICFFSIFVSLRVLQKNAVIYSNEQKAKSSYNEIQLKSNEYSSCSDIVKSLNILKTDFGAKINGIHFNLNNNELSLLMDGLGEISDTVYIVDDEEYNYSENEILCAENVRYNNRPINSGDNIKLFGEKLKAVKSGSSTTVSYSVFSKFNSSALDNISLFVENITFPEPLSIDDYATVSDIIKSFEPLKSEAEIADKNNSEVFGDQILVCILISALSVLIIITLFKQVMRNLISRISAFKLYGCKSSFVVFFFLISLFMYILISFAAASIIFSLCDGLFVRFNIEKPISFSLEFMSFAFVWILAVIFTLPHSVRLAGLLPAKLEIRR